MKILTNKLNNNCGMYGNKNAYVKLMNKIGSNLYIKYVMRNVFVIRQANVKHNIFHLIK
jgi:hypothetical protein